MAESGKSHSTWRRMETLAVHGGERRPGPEGSLVFPIYQGTVYQIPPGTPYNDITYIRLSCTPTQKYLQDKLAALEGAEAALATSSGMAAMTAILMTHLAAGDHLLVQDCLYGGTHDFVTHDAPRLGWSFDFIDPHRPESWGAAVRPNTKLLLLETISNPLMRTGRLAEAVAFGRERRIVTVIDNTFASPVNFRPLAAGFDLVFHSATKYLNGHSDLVAGCLMGAASQVEPVRRTLNHLGGSLDPHAAFLLARGLKTLAIRVKAQNANALALARSLSDHPMVAEVNYGGLDSHPDRAHASLLLSGFGGMLSLRLRGGAAAAERVLNSLRLATVAPSLGGVETLVTRPATTSHAGLSPEDRRKLGVTDDLVRVSCGIEAPEDLVEDFRQALEAA
jgi:cystathionine gamma-synthase/cystathionine gamma-lyase/cystathionine beta-lyase